MRACEAELGGISVCMQCLLACTSYVVLTKSQESFFGKVQEYDAVVAASRQGCFDVHLQARRLWGLWTLTMQSNRSA